MIKRIRNGWTTQENADAYEQFLDTSVFPGIEEKKLPGYRSIELMKRDLGDEVQFTTVMCFDSLASVIAFRGKDYEVAYVPPEARRLLKRWDERSPHHEVLQTRIYG